MGLPERVALVGLLAMACSAIGAGLGGEPVNVLSNGGFEEGLAGWEPSPGQSLVSDQAIAHSGAACLTGKLTESRQALSLRRRVAVNAGRRYEFSIWARATNGSKLALFIVPPEQSERKPVANWTELPDQWRRYSSPVTVDADGPLGLEIVAPSSFGAPPGQIWVDDIALMETPMPTLTPVSEGEGFNDEPAMSLAADGSVWVAWVSFREGADSLQVARFQPDGPGFRRLGAWQVVGGEKTYILNPHAAAAGPGAFVVYASEVDGEWNVYAVPCGSDGPGRPVAVTSAPGVDVKPVAAWHNGTLWVAWESNRNGSRQVFAASIRNGQASEAVPMSPANKPAYAPSITVLAGGEVCVAYHSFRENNYDVYLRRRSAEGSWQDETRLTRSPSIDRHPVLFARGDDLWIVYENARTEEYNIGRTNRRRLYVGRITAEGLLSPAGAAADSPLAGRCEAGSPAIDPDGRLWLGYLQPRSPHAGWDRLVTCFAAGRWQGTRLLTSRTGLDRRPVLAVNGSRAIVALQTDTIPGSWPDREQSAKSTSDIFLTSLDTASVPAGGPMQFEPLAESREPFEPAKLRVERGEDLPTPSIEYQGRKLNLYFGDLHEHTDVSVCNRLGDQSIDESYQHMRDIARYDFACATDHGYCINPYLWSYTAKMARTNEDRGRFLTFLAEEWTSTFEEYSEAHPYGFYGHRNLIFADPYFPRWWNARNYQTPAQVWEDLRKFNANFVHIPHQLADTGNVPTDWNFTDETAQPVAEIFQVRGSYEYKGTPREAVRTTPDKGSFLQDAWARGIVIGVIASPDHGGGYGKACVYAPDLTRTAILDALRARRCYGTSAAKIVLDVRVDGHLMGEKVATMPGKSVTVKVVARCPGDIDRIEVCRNNQFIYTKNPDGREAEFVFVDREPLAQRSYYYVRVIQKDEEIAWSSPVWFGAP
ncbi:MAG: CehA/McbA family metallohydrolase [Planctomycetes bacterium]|nr:CehA/McbA family metallohydrolase [Planctomycetota bacterium]